MGTAGVIYSIISNAFGAEFVLIFGKGHTSSVASKILRSVGDESSPTATDVKKSIKAYSATRTPVKKCSWHILVCRLEIQLVADNSKLIVLKLFQTLFNVRI